MSLLKNKNVLLAALLALILIVIYFAVTLKSPKVTEQKPAENSQNKENSSSFDADLDGDGINETIKIVTSDNGQTILEAYNKQGEKIATTPQERPIPAPFSYKAIKLDLNNNNEYIQWNRTAGAGSRDNETGVRKKVNLRAKGTASCRPFRRQREMHFPRAMCAG